MKKITICLSADEAYAWPLFVTIVSLLRSKNESTFYNINILVSKKFPAGILKYFENLSKSYQNFSINFIEMKSAFADIKMQISHITVPTFYRINIPKLFPDKKRVLYLDCDIIVLKDLSELFDEDLQDCYAGGVLAVGYILNQSNRDYYKRIGIDNLSSYINAGICLWNVEKIIEDNLYDELISHCEKNYSSMDQDVVNRVFYGKIKLLDLKYNLMTKYKGFFEDGEEFEKLAQYYGTEMIKNAVKNPTIIHYADKIKPWSDKNSILADFWWQTAQIHPFSLPIATQIRLKFREFKKFCEQSKDKAKFRLKKLIS